MHGWLCLAVMTVIGTERYIYRQMAVVCSSLCSLYHIFSSCPSLPLVLPPLLKISRA